MVSEWLAFIYSFGNSIEIPLKLRLLFRIRDNEASNPEGRGCCFPKQLLDETEYDTKNSDRRVIIHKAEKYLLP